MFRFLILLTFLILALAGTSNRVNAEVMRLDLGMGLTDYLSQIDENGSDLPVAGPVLTLGPDSIDQNGSLSGISGRMIVNPTAFDAQAQAAAYAEAERNFWTYMAILVATYLGGSYILGRQVKRHGWKVGYTRKGLALVLYFLPYFAMKGPSPYTQIGTASVSLGVFMLLLMSMSAPIRTRIPMMMTAFASVDRPEDRPFTLTWLITSTLAVWAIVYAWLVWSPETTGYLFVALFISGIGDALAEPVGLYFGKNPYKTKALGTDRTYIRTLEGSATVFVSGVVAVLLAHEFQLDGRALAALALFPIVGTIAEAKSPHTWDQPFIIGSCALVSVCLAMLPL